MCVCVCVCVCVYSCIFPVSMFMKVYWHVGVCRNCNTQRNTLPFPCHLRMCLINKIHYLRLPYCLKLGQANSIVFAISKSCFYPKISN